MSLEIIGDELDLQAIGVTVQSQIGDVRTGSRSTATIDDSPKETLPVAVRIPDLRLDKAYEEDQSTEQKEPAKTDRKKSRTDSKNVSPSGPLTSLEAIKEAIDSSSDWADHQPDDQTINQLYAAISGSDQEEEIQNESEPSKTAAPEKMAKKRLPKSECYLARLDQHSPEIQPVATAIEERFLSSQPGTILSFVSTEANQQLGPIVARTALALQTAKDKSILIVDCDLSNARLSKLLKLVNKSGLDSLGKPGGKLDYAIHPTSVTGIDATRLGLDAKDLKPDRLSKVVRAAIESIGTRFDYVLVNAGDAHGKVSEVFSDYVNGTFLVVNVQNSNQDVAKSAVYQQKSFGAKLLGCIATELDQ